MTREQEIAKKINVRYEIGESRNGNYAVDYMLATVEINGEEIELYAEEENPTWNAEMEDYEDETATYESLKSEILKQAKEHKVSENELKFMYD